MQPVSGSGPGLEVTRRRWVPWLWVPVVGVLVAIGVWWMANPAALPTSDDIVAASTKTGQPIYVGISIEARSGRSLAISEVTFHTAGDSANGLDSDDLALQPWICQDGSISQTTDPERFCAKVLPAEGHTLRLGDGDQLMISLESPIPVALHLEPIELAYRDGLQHGSGPIGPELELVVLA